MGASRSRTAVPETFAMVGWSTNTRMVAVDGQTAARRRSATTGRPGLLLQGVDPQGMIGNGLHNRRALATPAEYHLLVLTGGFICNIMRHTAKGGGGMSVRKRTWTTRRGEAKEAWIVDYTDADGDRHIETFDRKKDADARHAQVAVSVARGTHQAPSKSITVAEAAERWIKAVEAKGAERTTIRQYRQHIDLHIVPRTGAVKLAHLTPANLDNFRNDLLANMSRPLARKVMVSFKSLLKTSRYSHVIADVEAIGKSKRERKLEVGRDIPTAAEIKRLAAAAPQGKLRALLLTVALTGLRASELRGLRWSDVDLKHAELHVRQRADRWNRHWPVEVHAKSVAEPACPRYSPICLPP